MYNALCKGSLSLTPESWLLAARQLQPLNSELFELVQPNAKLHADALLSTDDFRARVCELMSKNLKHEDHDLARILTEQEILVHQQNGDSYVSDNLNVCAHILFRLGHVEDSLLVWRAKTISPDTQTGISIELIAGAGMEETLSYLRSVNSSQSLAALSYLSDYGELDVLDSIRRQTNGQLE